ncbi:hypothetical protein [Salinisphaera sp.]|uniref:hypothetical protein n=1 Tax=Salinisphaera sp. TaxID=1914330 RepID=UPI000C680D3C|nr:hypothetical protein [Salinisphaera sp.]MBS64598.1 hypothetical protein [Salinisphaera sp.]
MPRSRRRAIALPLLIVALAAGLPAIWFIWTLAKGHGDFAGGHVDNREFATIQSYLQRRDDGLCDRIFVTAEDTWLIGVADSPDSSMDLAGSTDLAELIRGDGSDGGGSYGVFGAGAGMRAKYGYISRLNDNGRFDVVARLDSSACMAAAGRDGRRVYVLSGMERPDNAYENDDPASRQDAVFVTDDQGRSWQWQREGFMVPSSITAWGVHPYRDAYDTVWAWQRLPHTQVTNGKPIVDGDGSGLYYSTDEGRSTTEVDQTSPLVASRMELEALKPAGMKLNGEAVVGEVEPHVMRLGEDRAAVWVSQQIGYSDPADASPYNAGALHVLRYARLNRNGGEWHMGKVEQTEGMKIQALRQGPDGRVRAVVRMAGETASHIALVDPDTLEIKPTAELPGAFAPLTSNEYVRGFWVGKHSMVVNVGSSYRVPTWINVGEWLSGDEAHISGNAVFYSVDDGRSWDRLAIPGYQGVLGFDAATDRVFWHRDGSYTDKSIQVDRLAED